VVHQLEALGIRLHQAVLDPVVDHLREVARARGPHVRPAVLRRKRLEHRLQPLHGRLVAARHQAEACLEAPDSSGDADVDERDALLARRVVPPLRVAEVRVAAVDDRVAGLEDVEQLLERVLRDRAGRDHQPDVARRVELLCQRAQRLRGRLDVRVERLHLVPRLREPLRHAGAHPAQSHHSKLH
jgi:hypothetical protein